MWLYHEYITARNARKRYFSEGRNRIAANNLLTLQIVGAVGAGVSFLFFLITPFIIPTWHITVEYIAIVPVLLVTFLFSFWYTKRNGPKNPLVVEIATILFCLLVLGVCIALSVFPYPGTPQIFISLCFMFMPVLLILRPVVILLIMAAAEAVFLLLAQAYKTSFSLQNDIFNTIASLLFAVIILVLIDRLRYRDHDTQTSLRRLGETDALTELWNKVTFEDRCAHALQHGWSATLLVLDLDDFKQVNDRCGHLFGDALLQAMGEKLRQALVPGDLAGRIGGDEFAVLLVGVQEQAAIERRCEALCNRLRDIAIDGTSFPVSVSIGAAVAAPGCSYTALFGRADNALYSVKSEKQLRPDAQISWHIDMNR